MELQLENPEKFRR